MLNRRFAYSFNYATIIIAVINVIVFIATGFGRNIYFDLVFGLQPVNFVYGHCYWQVFTYMFMHGSWAHLLGNMIFLVLFGFMTEKQLGTKEFVLFYLLCGVVCGILSVAIYIFCGMWQTVLVGASGAIYSVMLIFSVIFPKVRVYIYGLIPVTSPVMVMLYAGISIYDEVFGLHKGVAHLTHLSGIAVAWIYCLVRFRVSPIKVWLNALR